MIRIRKSTVLFILLALLVMALAACGGNGDDAGNNGDDAAGNNDNAGDVADDGDDGDTEVAAGDATAGQELFVSSCSACHGPEGEGVEGLGKDLTTSEFVAEQSDEELLEFIKVGRPASDPANTTGVDMPPKGGNPALTDAQILDIIAFIREIHE